MAQDYIPAVVPTPGQVVSVVLQMSTFGVLCICFSEYLGDVKFFLRRRCLTSFTARRTSWIKHWRKSRKAIIAEPQIDLCRNSTSGHMA